VKEKELKKDYRSKWFMTKKREVYRYYPLRKLLVINERLIEQIIISSHYEISHPYLTDEIILELVKKLDGKTFQVEDKKSNPNREFFSQDRIGYQGYKYKLVWLLWEKGSNLGVIACYRRKKYEKK